MSKSYFIIDVSFDCFDILDGKAFEKGRKGKRERVTNLRTGKAHERPEAFCEEGKAATSRM